jgi:hypothetical protein
MLAPSSEAEMGQHLRRWREVLLSDPDAVPERNATLRHLHALSQTRDGVEPEMAPQRLTPKIDTVSTGPMAR